MRAALDTNLLVYAEGFGDRPRVDASRALLQRLAELFRVLTGKAGRSALEAQEAVLSWMEAYPTLDSTSAAWQGTAADAPKPPQKSILVLSSTPRWWNVVPSGVYCPRGRPL